MAHDVFISYSSKDKPIGDGVCANLESAGVRCWIAPRDIAAGEDWPTAITHAIENSRILVLVFSANSNTSEDVSRELYLAANNKLVIIPFKIDDVKPEAGKQYYLARTHWLDAMNPPTKEQIATLVQRVKSILPVITPEVQTTSVEPPGREIIPKEKVLPKEEDSLAARLQEANHDEKIPERGAGRRVKKTPTAPRLQEAKNAEPVPEPETARRVEISSDKPPEKKGWAAWVIGAGGLVLIAFIVTLVLLLGNGSILKPVPTFTLTSTATITPTETRTPTITVRPTPELGIGSTWWRPAEMMRMRYVPEGEFTMGSNTGFYDERPVHTVFLDAYWIDQTEVTNAMYALCVSTGACRSPSDYLDERRGSYYGTSEYADYPVIFVDWQRAQKYCEWAGARLPTEAEWEKAARGTDGRAYPWGDETPTCSLANFGGCGSLSPVGSYPSGASPYGPVNLAGNVLEWVADWYGEYYYSISPESNPTGPTSGDLRVLRGGSVFSTEDTLRSAYRGKSDPSGTNQNIGFRCARSLP